MVDDSSNSASLAVGATGYGLVLFDTEKLGQQSSVQAIMPQQTRMAGYRSRWST